MSDSSAALAAGLRLAAHRLGAVSVHAYASGPDARLACAGSSDAAGPAPAVASVAESLGPDLVVLDVSGVLDGPRFAAGRRTDALALVAFGVPLDRIDDAWDAAFLDAFALAGALAGALADPAQAAFPSVTGHARLLHEVATHPGSFDERLQIGLAGLTEALGVEASAFCAIDAGQWRSEARVDPTGILPAGPVALEGRPCSITVCADGPVSLNAPGAYLGTPVFADGRTIGTLVATSRTPRAVPFTPDDRALIESLARWVGSAIGGRAAARRLSDREAALSAFVDRAPVAMGLVVHAAGASDDVQFVTVNAAASRLLGVPGADVAGRLASEVGIGERTRRAWALGCEQALALAPGTALPPVMLDFEAAAGVRVLSVTLGRLDVHDTAGAPVACVSFVAEDVTERELSLRSAAERRDAFEQTTVQQAALFETLHHDLRTPLTTILGYADLLGDAMPPDELQAVREVLLRSGGNLLALLDDAVAGADAARASVSLVPVDAGRLVGAAVETCGPAAAASGVALDYVSEAGTAPVLLDPALVERVVQALIGEAIGQAPGGGAVDAHFGEDGRQFVFGAGVRGGAPAAAAAVSRPAVALAERLAERMGGTLSETGGGQWSVRLPRHPAVVVQMPTSPASAGR